MESGGLIRISLSRAADADKLIIVVEDNGAGLASGDTAANISPVPIVSHKGYALNNIMERFQLYYGERASIRFTDRVQGQGCRVELTIALRKEETGDDNRGTEDARAV
ncbi:hypothetical protein D3C75_831740 [compost metagenome]